MACLKKALALALPLFLYASSSRAQTAPEPACSGSTVSTCINSDTLWPHFGPARFVAVGGTETVARSQVGFGLLTSYQSRPIVLQIPSPGPSGSDQNVIDHQLTTTFLWSYGVTDRLELGLAMPVTLFQDGTGVSPLTGGKSLQGTAMRDLRFGMAYAIVPRTRTEPEKQGHYGLAGRFVVSAPTGDRDQFAGERSAAFVPSIAGDYRRGKWFAGAEIGARLRATTELAGARIGTQLLVALGVGYDILPREKLSAILEARALPTLTEQADAFIASSSVPNGKYVAPAEWSLSLRTAPLFGGDLAFQLGGGGTIPLASEPAPTTPRFRFTLGIRFAPQARDTDGDGVLDKDDRCPDQRGYGEPRDGCPHEAAHAAPPLRLFEKKSACPRAPRSVDTFGDDGCAVEKQ
jgi:hypothetical protein